MRSCVLIALFLPLSGCAWTTAEDGSYPVANDLMRKEIQSRIADFPYRHGSDLLNDMLWLETKAGDSAVPFLVEALQNPNPKIRSSSLWVLGRLKNTRTIPNIRPLTADEHPAVRLEAARTLVTMGDLKYCTLLIDALDSDKTTVRYHCHMALKDATKRDFQYDHLEEDLAVRRGAVLRWRQWWSEQSADPWFAESYAREHGLARPGQGARPMGETGNRSQQPEQPQHGTEPGTGAQPGQGAGTQPEQGTGTQPGQGTGTQPGQGTGTQPGQGTGTQPGQGTGTQPGQGTQPEQGNTGGEPGFKPLPVPGSNGGNEGANGAEQPNNGTGTTTTPKTTTPKTTDPKTTDPKTTDPKIGETGAGTTGNGTDNTTEKPAGNPVFKLLDEPKKGTSGDSGKNGN